MPSWSTAVVAGAVGLLVGWLSTIFFNRKQLVDELSALAGVLDKIKPVAATTRQRDSPDLQVSETRSAPESSLMPAEVLTSPEAVAHQELAEVVRLQTLRVVALIRYPPLLRLEVGLLLFCYLVGAFLFLFASYFLGLDAPINTDDRWTMLLIISAFWLVDVLLGLILLRQWSGRARTRVEFLLHRIQGKDDRGDVVDVLGAAQTALAFIVLFPMTAGGMALVFGAFRYELVNPGTWPGIFLLLAGMTLSAIIVLPVMSTRLSLERTPEQRLKAQQRESQQEEKKKNRARKLKAKKIEDEAKENTS